MSDITTLAVAYAGIEMVKPMAHQAADLLGKLLGKPFTVAGDLLADGLYQWQTLNRIKFAAAVSATLKRTGVDPSIVPPGFLLPIIEAVGNVDDEYLRNWWVRLTVEGVRDAGARHPMFGDVLRRLNRDDAQVFDRLVHAGGHDYGFGLSDTTDDRAVGRLISLGLMEYVYTGEVDVAMDEPEAIVRMIRAQQQPNPLTTTNVHLSGEPLIDRRRVKLFTPAARISQFGMQFHARVAVDDPQASSNA